MQCLLILLSVTVCASATVELESLLGYHERVGIPTATRIKAAEDAHFANQNLMSRIVGGVVSQPNAHPYLGGLLINYKNHASTGVCGSSLISPNRVVTAAHCWFDGRLQAVRYVVVVGSQFLFSGGQRIITSTIAVHPRWNPATLQNDIAVLYLQNPVSLSSSVQPIALPNNRDESFEGAAAVAVGYGMTSDDQLGISMTSTVIEVYLQVITLEQCQAEFGSLAQPIHVCTSGVGGVGLCGGDNGGPLFVDRDGSRVLIGVGSFMAGGRCQQGLPSGFSRVTSFYDFLTLHLQ